MLLNSRHFPETKEFAQLVADFSWVLVGFSCGFFVGVCVCLVGWFLFCFSLPKLAAFQNLH